MSYKRMGYDGEIWIEDRAYNDAALEIGRLRGLVEAKDQEIARLSKRGVQDFQSFQDRIEEFQRSRFPDQKLAGKFAHLAREVDELRANPDDPMEWADVFILFLGAAAMHDLSVTALLVFADSKLTICEKRKWGPADADGVHHHIE